MSEELWTFNDLDVALDTDFREIDGEFYMKSDTARDVADEMRREYEAELAKLRLKLVEKEEQGGRMTTTAIQAKERPIIFSAEMVRAILRGKKTQTRRVVKPDLVTGWDENGPYYEDRGGDYHPTVTRCPYGMAGDLLWIRETHAYPKTIFGAPNYMAMKDDEPIRYRADGAELPEYYKWRPSIHMPRWASRITLQVTGVRVERVQDISCNDILAEGVGDPYKAPEQLRPMFAHLWDSINGKRPGCTWNDNPWVWIVEFERIKP